jgi:hypothetical protein
LAGCLRAISQRLIDSGFTFRVAVYSGLTQNSERKRFKDTTRKQKKMLKETFPTFLGMPSPGAIAKKKTTKPQNN